jgi:hypothetical protein
MRFSWRLSSCCCWTLGFWRRVDLQVDADVSETHTASIFRGWSDKEGKWRVYIGRKEQGPRKGSQSEGENMGMDGANTKDFDNKRTLKVRMPPVSRKWFRQRLSWEANRRSSNQEVSYLLWKLKISGCCYGMVSYKASHALQPFSDLLCVTTSVLLIHESSSTAVWQTPADT